MSSFFSMDSPIMRFLSRVCDLIILNLLTIVCCIPIFTAGASITALFSVTLKMVKGEESYIVRGFFKGFKENFKQSTIIWLIIAVLGLFLFMDYRAAVLLPGNMKSIFQVLIGAIAVIYLMVFTYIFPYIARFRNDIKNIFKRFYRADTARPYNGSFGLGLSIAQNVVTLHKGKIWEESADGVNRFIVELPML